MLEPSNIKLGEFEEMPYHYLERVTSTGIPLVIRMMEADHIDVAIVREQDYLALMRQARPHDEPPTQAEMQAAAQAAGRVLAADHFDRTWEWLISAAAELREAYEQRNLAAILLQAAWLLSEVEEFVGVSSKEVSLAGGQLEGLWRPDERSSFNSATRAVTAEYEERRAELGLGIGRLKEKLSGGSYPIPESVPVLVAKLLAALDSYLELLEAAK